MKWTIVFSIGVFWALMMYFLFDREIRPYLDEQAPLSYRQFLFNRDRLQTVEMTILRGVRRRKIGMYRATITPEKSGFFKLVEHVGLDVQFGTLTLHATTETKTTIDPEFQLALLSMTMECGGKSLNLTGARIGQDKLKIIMDSPLTGKEERMLPFSRDMTLSNDFSPFIRLPGLRVGREWTVYTLSPNFLKRDVSIVPLRARVVERETQEWGGRTEVPVHRIEVSTPEADGTVMYRVWTDLDGRVLIVEQGDGSDQDMLRIERAPDAADDGGGNGER